MPSRNGSVTDVCWACGGPLSGRALRWCSEACRQAGWRQRHQSAPTSPPLPPGRPRRDTTVYECPDCQARLLGTQYCQDCLTFCRRLGSGGLCPCCDEPITFDELIQAS